MLNHQSVSYELLEDSDKNFDFKASDSDNDNLTFEVLVAPSYGSVEVKAQLLNTNPT